MSATVALIERGEAEASEKRPGAFRTISEVASDLDVPQHVLRFWETRFAQVKPVKRAGGRRYYRPEDVDLLKGIRNLLHGRGYTIKGAQRVLKESGVRFVQSIGRGEVEAAAPAFQEGEVLDAEAGGVVPDGAALPDTARSTIEGVLGDLLACRAALVALRQPPESAAF